MRLGLLKPAVFLGAALVYEWWNQPTAEQLKVEQSAYYPNCAQARAAGVAPIYRGQPAYRDALDADGDGIACEPYNGSD